MERNLFRTGTGLTESLARLDDAWTAAVPQLATGPNPQRAREAAALVAHARWMYRAALARTESRAMHHRDDRPNTDPGQGQRLRTGGLDQVWVAAESAAGEQELAS